MADKNPIELQLRRRFGRFLIRPGKVRIATSILKGWEERGWGPILFGGVIRDLVVLGARYYPRDVDVVLSNATTEELVERLQGQKYHLNRFGGVHLNVGQWVFDVWPLEKTWAFSNDHSLLPTPENLPKTTFLDVEAIAVTLNGSTRIGQIHSHGFFEAVESRCIGINYRDNPFPALCAVRAVITACKLNYQLSLTLAAYFVETVSEQGARELVYAQEHHYKKVVLRESDIDKLQSHFKRTLDRGKELALSLPDNYHPSQLRLWPDETRSNTPRHVA